MSVKTILLILAIVMALLIFIFWMALANKSKDVSKREPYLYLLNNELMTTAEVILIDNATLLNAQKDYPKEISYAHRYDTAQIPHQKLSVGSTVIFTKAIHFTSAVSGVQSAILFGKVNSKDDGVEHAFIYVWGNFKTICIDKPCDYWAYEKGFWE
jgi:hypothetical protein